MLFVRYTKYFLVLALGIIAASGIALSVTGLSLGIDFTGGSLAEVTYTERPEKAAAEEALAAHDLGGYSLRESTDEAGRPAFVLRTRSLSEEERQEVSGALTSLGAGGEVTRFTSVGPVIGEELQSKALVAIGLVALMIVLYVAYAFRGLKRPVRSWVYGAITVLALAHDVLVPTAAFAVVGAFTGAEVDVLFVMAILAVLGYSVNDTIVVFDRVRENLIARQEADAYVSRKDAEPVLTGDAFAEIVGQSISQTYARSINTSLTTFLALAALYLFGGDVTRNFALVLAVGVIAGTYSSLFFAGPLLVAFDRWQRSRSIPASNES